MKSFAVLALLTCTLVLTACMTTTHKVGNGGSGASSEEHRMWYALWGLVPLNETDTSGMAAGATDYTVKTERNVIDVIIGIFTGFITVYPQTTTVTK